MFLTEVKNILYTRRHRSSPSALMKPSPQSFQRYPLSVIFNSPANARVLRALARHGGALTVSTLVEATHLTRPSVLSALRQLVHARVADVLGSARPQLYRFAESTRLGKALSALFDRAGTHSRGRNHP